MNKMKKIIIIMAAVALLCVCGCSKNTKCKCTTTTATDDRGRAIVTHVDATIGFPCKKITRLGIERQIDGKLVREMQEVTCVEE